MTRAFEKKPYIPRIPKVTVSGLTAIIRIRKGSYAVIRSKGHPKGGLARSASTYHVALRIQRSLK